MSMIFGYARVSTKTQDIRRQIRNIRNQYPKEQFPDLKIYQEAHTGTKLEGREELDKLIRKVKTDDTIVFDSASRMSRNADEAMELYEKLFRKGVHLVFLNEPHINTDVYKKSLDNQISIHTQTGNRATDEFLKAIIEALNKYTLDLASEQIRRVFEQAEKEVKDIQKRVKDGIAKQKEINQRLKEEDPEHYREREEYKQVGHTIDDDVKLTVKKSLEAKPKILKKSKDFNGTLNDTELCKTLGISRNTLKKYKRELLEEQNG